MNKQQLASKIWESANKMRSKIEANEYKDYILGFIFYKFLSNKEVLFLEKMGLSDEELKTVTEDNIRVRDMLKSRIGYFISYENLFSTWISMKNDFDVSNVRDGLSAFNRLINESHKKVYEGIFDVLETGLNKLGDSAKSQTKSIRDLIYLINDIPMDNKQDYDVLGFIYEFLISNFAANAGKKAGEFYTPHEVSLLMSEIVAEHLKDRDTIEIYDPTSGSGSLLINIGKTASKYIKEENKIKYYAQELKQNTYNLTRMNLIMRGILPDNIITRNGDTLAEDWPVADASGNFEPLHVDAVVSNPPYSQNWDSKDAELDSRFKDFGVAPKSKADYAFLLHDLYHLNGTGIMTIVLPHGVLFRGNEEYEIRKNLIEHNNIDAIIGLPANIFFGTQIPTIIMILKKEKNNTDILMVDASKGFIKEGKNNKLRSSDIKKIVDVVTNRQSLSKFSRIITRDEVRENDYNLNIPRYIDSTDDSEEYDIYSILNGGIPKNEIDKFDKYFDVFPTLKSNLFTKINEQYYTLSVDNIHDFVLNHSDVIEYKNQYLKQFDNFDDYLYDELINNINGIDSSSEEDKIANALFNRVDNIKLIDRYQAYQILDDTWNIISSDLELISTEGIDACRKLDPIMEIKKKGDEEIEVQVGTKGHVIPFDLVIDYKLSNLSDNIKQKEIQLSDIDDKITELFDELSEEEKGEIEDTLNDENEAFVAKEVARKAKVYLKAEISEGSVEAKIIEVNNLFNEQKQLSKKIKENIKELDIEVQKEIQNLTDEEIYYLLNQKWILPIISGVNSLVDELIREFSDKLFVLSNKYSKTMVDIDKEIESTEKDIIKSLSQLTGDDFDMKGISDLMNLIGGNKDE